jgi:L-asparaginase/Glu-tRNA(Gln) amidotransferase subunit D
VKLKKTKDGLDFLGYIIRPDYILSRNRVINNYKWKKARQSELDNFSQIQASYLGHLKHCNCQNLREKEKNEKSSFNIFKLNNLELSRFH